MKQTGLILEVRDTDFVAGIFSFVVAISANLIKKLINKL